MIDYDAINRCSCFLEAITVTCLLEIWHSAHTQALLLSYNNDNIFLCPLHPKIDKLQPQARFIIWQNLFDSQ